MAEEENLTDMKEEVKDDVADELLPILACKRTIQILHPQSVRQMVPKKRPRHAASSSQNRSPERVQTDPIPFKNDGQRARYEKLATRQVCVSYYFDESTLNTLGIYDDVMRLVNNIGWNAFVALRPRVYVTLTLEFLSSFSLSLNTVQNKSGATAEFRLLGKDHAVTLEQLNDMFGFNSEGETYYSVRFRDTLVWREYTREHSYSSRMSKASQLIRHSHRYMHRYIAHTILGRGESTGVVGKAELFFLWCMENREAVNTGLWLLKHLQQVARKEKGKILVGGLITHIATCLGALNESTYHEPPIGGNDRLNVDRLVAMGFCKRENGRFYLVDPQGNAVAVGETSPALVAHLSDDQPQPSQFLEANRGSPRARRHGTPQGAIDMMSQILHHLQCMDEKMDRFNDKMDWFHDKITRLEHKVDEIWAVHQPEPQPHPGTEAKPERETVSRTQGDPEPELETAFDAEA